MNDSQPDVMDSLTKAWDRMTELMFQQFEWKNWAIVGFVAFMVSCGRGAVPNSGFNNDLSSVQGMSPEFIIGAIIGIMSIGFLFLIAGYYLGSHAEFSMVNRVSTGDLEGGPLVFDSNFSHLGNSLFVLRLALFLIPTLIVFGLALLIMGSFAFPDIELFASIQGFVLVILVLVSASFYFLFQFISFLVNNFVVPIMYTRDIKAFPALAEAWSCFVSNPLSSIFFLFMRIVLSILMGIASVIAIIPLCCVCIGGIPIVNALAVSMLIAPIHVLMTAFSLYYMEGHLGKGTLIKDRLTSGGLGGIGSGSGMGGSVYPMGGGPYSGGPMGGGSAGGATPPTNLRSQVYVQPTFEEFEAQQRALLEQQQQYNQQSNPEQEAPQDYQQGGAYNQGTAYDPSPYAQPTEEPQQPDYSQQSYGGNYSSEAEQPPLVDYSAYSRQPESLEEDSRTDAYQPPPPPTDEYDPDAARYGGGGDYKDDRYAVDTPDPSLQDSGNYPPPPPPPSDYYPEEQEKNLPPPPPKPSRYASELPPPPPMDKPKKSTDWGNYPPPPPPPPN